MINEVKLENLLLELGHAENMAGTELIRVAVRMYRPRIGLTTELYPAIAGEVGTTPGRAERSMRYAIEVAWRRGSAEAQQRLFGWSINPLRGVPTIGEYLARLWRLCHED